MIEQSHSTDGKEVIELRGIKKIYPVGDQEVAALAGINLDIRQGEFAALWFWQVHIDEYFRVS